MNRLGSGCAGEFTFIDYINIISLMVGIQNLELNITQEDMDNQTAELDERVDIALNTIQTHLKLQDSKINEILKRLEK